MPDAEFCPEAREGRRVAGLPGDTCSSALSINDGDEFVGTSGSRAFLYVKGRMYDLNSLISPADPLLGSVKLTAAVSINSSAWIAVNGTDTSDGLSRAFVLIPLH